MNLSIIDLELAIKFLATTFYKRPYRTLSRSWFSVPANREFNRHFKNWLCYGSLLDTAVALIWNLAD
jgi:hypothetical protein